MELKHWAIFFCVIILSPVIGSFLGKVLFETLFNK